MPSSATTLPLQVSQGEHLCSKLVAPDLHVAYQGKMAYRRPQLQQPCQMLIVSGGLSPISCTHAGYYGADVQTIRNYERSRAEFRKILVRLLGWGAAGVRPKDYAPRGSLPARSLSLFLSHFSLLSHFSCSLTPSPLPHFLPVSLSLSPSASFSPSLSLALTRADLLWHQCVQVTTFLEMLCEEYRRCEQVRVGRPCIHGNCLSRPQSRGAVR